MEEVIRVEQLTKSYGQLLAVKALSLRVERGSVFGLLGANGAGKSTAIECIPVSYTHLFIGCGIGGGCGMVRCTFLAGGILEAELKVAGSLCGLLGIAPLAAVRSLGSL